MRAVLLGVLLCSALALAEDKVVPRQSTTAQLRLPVERFVLSNGLVVLLSPNPTLNGVAVDLSFAAGVLYQPPGKAGLAHLTEHAFAVGPTPDTAYDAILERKGGIDFGAFTTFDRMNFRVLVPPEELPLALWVNADRIGGPLAITLTASELKRHQRIVAQERLQRIDDAPYGGTSVALMRSLFPEGHPAHNGLIGGRAEIEALTLDDVLAFAGRLLVPANGVLTIVGHFDPIVARRLVEQYFGALPAGAKAAAPPPPPPTPSVKVAVTEELGRRPSVTQGWLIADPVTALSDALTFGSLLVRLYTDGFVGMNVSSSFTPFRGGGLFVLDVVMPHTLSAVEAAGNAEVVFRYLSMATMPADVIALTLLAWDREVIRRRLSLNGLASTLSAEEANPPDAPAGFEVCERHWAITGEAVQGQASVALKGARVTVQARPTRPLPQRLKP